VERREVMKIHRPAKWKMFAGLTAMLVIAACTQGGNFTKPPDPTLNKSLTLVSFGSCSELESEIKAMLTGEMEKNADGLKKYCRYQYEGGSTPDRTPVVNDSQGEDNSADATGTNLQEEGVDEADLIKTDGRYAYAIVGSEVKIVRIAPFTEFGLISKITPLESPTGIYLADGKLIVLSSGAPGFDSFAPVGVVCAANSTSGCIPPPLRPEVIEEIYDVSDPLNPKLIRRESYAGVLLDSRRIGARLYLIISENGIVYPLLDYDLGIDYDQLPVCPDSGESTPTNQMLNAIENIKEKNRLLIQSLSLSDLMPSVGEGREHACTEIMRSESAVGTQLLTVLSDKLDETSQSKMTILSNGGTVYASKGAIYVTATSMPYGWWGLSVSLDEFKDATVVHRFSLDQGNLSYSGSAEVEGHLLDNNYVGFRYSTRFSMAQFAMSEYDGYLRIATTRTVSDNGGGSGAIAPVQFIRDNRVFVLDANSPSLERVGEVGQIAADEWIHAVRFIGNRGYVVTFKKTDPLFVIDLSEPQSPKVVGELKVPGFSTYLHPFDDGYLIGLGFYVDDMGSFAWTQGLKLSLFDVTNPSSPSEIGYREIGSRGSYSAAVEEHHAFTLDKNRGMLALPVDIYEGGTGESDFGTHAYSGVLLLKADLSGNFDTIGKIVFETYDNNDDMWARLSNDVLRTVIIGDEENSGVVTLTKFGVQLNRIDQTMSLVGSVQ